MEGRGKQASENQSDSSPPGGASWGLLDKIAAGRAWVVLLSQVPNWNWGAALLPGVLRMPQHPHSEQSRNSWEQITPFSHLVETVNRSQKMAKH